jgi:hypothetical protein
MTSATLSTPVVAQSFPGGTVDTPFSFVVTGILADGVTPFADTEVGPDVSTASFTFNLQPGTYTGVVTKLGISCLASGPLVITVPTTVTLSVPDATKQATFA